MDIYRSILVTHKLLTTTLELSHSSAVLANNRLLYRGASITLEGYEFKQATRATTMICNKRRVRFELCLGLDSFNSQLPRMKLAADPSSNRDHDRLLEVFNWSRRPKVAQQKFPPSIQNLYLYQKDQV